MPNTASLNLYDNESDSELYIRDSEDELEDELDIYFKDKRQNKQGSTLILKY
jgi:hypothetical protein